jgi:hypothetical protein
MSDRSATAVVAVRIRHVESVADESVQVHIRATPSMGPTDRMAGMDFGEPTLIAGGSSCLFQLPWAAGISAPPRGPVGDSAGQFERAYNTLGDIQPELVKRARVASYHARRPRNPATAKRLADTV